MSSDIKVIQQLDEARGPRTVEEQRKALRDAQTFLAELYGDGIERTNATSVDDQILALQIVKEQLEAAVQVHSHLAKLLAKQQGRANGTPAPDGSPEADASHAASSPPD